MFLNEPGVEPTNNRAERALRFGVLWRKGSLGTASAKGNAWVQRSLSLRLCQMAHAPPSGGQWQAWYARLCRLVKRYESRADDAGRLVRH